MDDAADHRDEFAWIVEPSIGIVDDAAFLVSA